MLGQWGRGMLTLLIDVGGCTNGHTFFPAFAMWLWSSSHEEVESVSLPLESRLVSWSVTPREFCGRDGWCATVSRGLGRPHMPLLTLRTLPLPCLQSWLTCQRVKQTCSPISPITPVNMPDTPRNGTFYNQPGAWLLMHEWTETRRIF